MAMMTETPKAPSGLGTRAALIGAALALSLLVAATAGARYGFLLLIGLGFGIALEGLRFGFAGPWRAMILRREGSGILAQLLAIALVALAAFPLLANHGGELSGAVAPVGFAMVLGAFVFGVAMQIVLGCGSGTLVNAGSGNAISLVALPFFAIGSFLGASHLVWWTQLGTLPALALSGFGGLGVTLALLAIVAALVWRFSAKEARALPRRLVIAALVIAGLAVLNLIVAGQPWGVVYGLGLWVGKAAAAMGADLAANPFWGTAVNQERLSESLLTDVTSLTNIGIILGAFGVAVWRKGLDQPLPNLPARAWIAAAVAGLALGYSARLAFGCNVGAFFSGISTGSLHGWVWFGAAFLGSIWGVRLRRPLGLEG